MAVPTNCGCNSSSITLPPSQCKELTSMACVCGLLESLDSKQNKAVIDPSQITLWNPLEYYIAPNKYVTYVNPSSLDPQFQKEIIYRCDKNTVPGESPETNPEKWIAEGSTGYGSIEITDVIGLRSELDIIESSISNIPQEAIDTEILNNATTNSTTYISPRKIWTWWNNLLTSFKITSWGTPSNETVPSSKLVKDSLDLKQDALSSGSNIKTVNSTSLLGSGNIAVEPTIIASDATKYYRGDKTWQNAGNAIGRNIGTTVGTVAAGDDSRIVGSEQTSNKVIAFSSPTDVQYPSAKLVNDQLNAITLGQAVTVGTGGQYATVQLAYADGKRNIFLISDVTESITFTISQKTNITSISKYLWTISSLVTIGNINVLTCKNIGLSMNIAYGMALSAIYENCSMTIGNDIPGGTYINSSLTVSSGGSRFINNTYCLINSTFVGATYIQFMSNYVSATGCTFTNTLQNNSGSMDSHFENCIFNSIVGIRGYTTRAINCKFLGGVYIDNNAGVSDSYVSGNVIMDAGGSILSNSRINGNVTIVSNFNKISNCYIGTTNGGTKTITINSGSTKNIITGNTTEDDILDNGTGTIGISQGLNNKF